MNNDRAVQFAPFDSLRGYYLMVQAQKSTPCPRRELDEYECSKTNDTLCHVKKGDMLRVMYYKGDRYHTAVGVCQKVDLTFGSLTVLNHHIPTEDIIYIEIE